jgi:hypothetical protein
LVTLIARAKILLNILHFLFKLRAKYHEEGFGGIMDTVE